MMEPNFVIWAAKNVPNACCLNKLSGVEKLYQLKKGIPRSDSFSEDASFSMDPDFPYDTVLTDNLINVDMLIVASTRLKEFLEARYLRSVEYLPVTILDHKQKPIIPKYFVIHLIDPMDCLEIDGCGARWSKIDKETIQNVERLVIDLSKIDQNREMFRPKSFYRVTLVRRELAQAIDKEKFTGIRWIEMSDYPED